MPLTVLTGMFGTNVEFPAFLGGARAEFWGILGGTVTISGCILWCFRRRDWI